VILKSQHPAMLPQRPRPAAHQRCSTRRPKAQPTPSAWPGHPGGHPGGKPDAPALACALATASACQVRCRHCANVSPAGPSSTSPTLATSQTRIQEATPTTTRMYEEGPAAGAHCPGINPSRTRRGRGSRRSPPSRPSPSTRSTWPGRSTPPGHPIRG
jgi:hypothetical protein